MPYGGVRIGERGAEQATGEGTIADRPERCRGLAPDLRVRIAQRGAQRPLVGSRDRAEMRPSSGSCGGFRLRR
ncbi:MAG TPA: hypothetical protein VFZ24_02600 [Longimicrobiales bacterium]